MTWKSSKPVTEHRDAMQDLANAVIEQFERGIKPWVRPWDPLKCRGPDSPFNPVTKHVYRGINVLALGMHPLTFQTNDPRWLTFKQAQDKGWNVKKGSKASAIFFTKQLGGSLPDDGDEEDKPGKQHHFFLKSYAVFHSSQVDGIPPYEPPTVAEAPWQSDEATEIIMKNGGVPVKIGGDRAFYSPNFDFIQIPPSVAFNSAQDESCTKLHELAHSTGAEKRLNRDMTGAFGSAKYAEEELVAELASAFIGMTLNLPVEIPNHANYIGHWLEKLKGDKRFIFKAASQAQKASDWILNLHPAFAAVRSENSDAPAPDRPATSGPASCGQPSTASLDR